MGYDLTIAGPEPRAVLDLRGDRAALDRMAGPLLPPWPARPCSLTRRDDRALLWLGPDRWLLVAPLAQEDALENALPPYHPDAGLTLVSDTLAFFAVTGPDADVALSIACPLDIDPGAFGADGAAVTDAFGVRALVFRAEGGWCLAVEPALAAYIGTQLAQIV